MLPISPAESLDELERVAARLEFRLYTMENPEVSASSYAPMQEAELAAEVDQHCLAIARAIAWPMTAAMPVMDARCAYLAMRRLRDAQRCLREQRRKFEQTPDKVAWYARLLVDDWHAYAEPYWYERIARYEERLALQKPARTSREPQACAVPAACR